MRKNVLLGTFCQLFLESVAHFSKLYEWCFFYSERMLIQKYYNNFLTLILVYCSFLGLNEKKIKKKRKNIVKQNVTLSSLQYDYKAKQFS